MGIPVSRGVGSAMLVKASIAPDRDLLALRNDGMVYSMFQEYFEPSVEQHDKG